VTSTPPSPPGSAASRRPRPGCRARQLRGHLTLLRREAARRFVQRATAAEAAAGRMHSDRLHVAVLPFVDEPPTGTAPPPRRRPRPASTAPSSR
jgi:hypothetical protein